jgi:hypothetical protein
MKPGDKVKILPISWIHAAGWVKNGNNATGVVVKVYQNGKVSVRVNEVRNSLKRDCEITKGEKRVCSFVPLELEP